MGDIALSSAVRENLLALQNTADMMSTTQYRLSTGKEVNTALDNPANFFTASAMSARASDLSGILDSMSTAVNTLTAADNAITAITDLVESAKSTATQALNDASGQASATVLTDSINGATTKNAAEGKKLVGDLGLTAGDEIEVKVSNGAVDTITTVTIDANTTMKDFVEEINDNLDSEMTASITTDGKLSLETKDGGQLTLSMNDADTSGNDLQDLLGATVTYNGSSGTAVDDGTNDTQSFAAPTGTTNETREKLADQFDDILSQISALSDDAEFNGINLLGGDDLKVVFNEKTGSNQTSLTIKGVDMDYGDLGIDKSTGDFQTDAEIETRLTQLTDALSQLRTQASEFGSNLTTVEVRQNYTEAMISTLEVGAADLTLADTNEEGANMLALQTRQQLSTKALSLASQADQAVLSFLR
jgi:flagellin-like hook-associated protein FlgL